MKIKLKNNGFTLLELLIAMAISSIVVAGIATSYNMQVKTKVTQEVIVEAQQNLRAAMYVMTREIRMAGYDPGGTGNFGITNISDSGASSTISFTGSDFDGDGNNEDITYSVYDSTTLGLPCLGRDKNDGLNSMPLAQGIQAMGLAYAYDNDGDGQLDTSGGNTIWAADTTGNNKLNANLDTNGDGVIDTNDGSAGAPLGQSISMDRIRAVRIWLLARTRVTRPGYTDNRTYKVGRSKITVNDNFRRRLLSTTVKCRNLGI